VTVEKVTCALAAVSQQRVSHKRPTRPNPALLQAISLDVVQQENR
jgi:hypothetical protein